MPTPPLWDDVVVPPDYTLEDINGLVPESLCLEWQSIALAAWIADEYGTAEEFIEREWNLDEGIFVARHNVAGTLDAVVLVLEVV